MTNVFGTPVYVYSADDPANREGKGDKGGKNPVSTMLKDVIKNLQPLEKALAALEGADKALDGTGYEDLRKAIQQVTQQVTTKTQEMVAQIGGQQAQPGQSPALQFPQQFAPQQSAEPLAAASAKFVPTAGQIAGTEPIPDEQRRTAAAVPGQPAAPQPGAAQQPGIIEQAEIDYLSKLADSVEREALKVIQGPQQDPQKVISWLDQTRHSLSNYVNGKPAPSTKRVKSAADFLLSALNIAVNNKDIARLRGAANEVRKQLAG